MTPSPATLSPSLPTIERREWRFVWAMAIFVLILTSLPYLYGYLTTPVGKQYMGIMIDVPDHTQYFSWMREQSQHLLISNKLTPEPNKPIFFNLLWWILGQPMRWWGLNYAVMFQALRVIATLAFLPAAYRICAWFLPTVLMRKTAFLLIVFAGGFGWLLIVGKYLLHLTDLPLHIQLLLYIVEPNTFFSILSTPHLVAAALYVFVFDLVLIGETKGQLRYAVIAGLFALFLGLQHAYDLFLMYGILGAYGLLRVLRDRKIPLYLLWTGLILGGISFWPGIYSALLTSLDPIWRAVLSQYGDAGVFSPNPLLIWVLMGPTFLVALYKLFRCHFWQIRQKDNRQLFLIGWFWINFILLYIPTDFQIKMLNGWQIPIAIWATLALFDHIIPGVEKFIQARNWSFPIQKLQTFAMVSLLVIAMPTNLYLWAWRFIDLGRHTYPYYLRQDEVKALDCLSQQGVGDDTVFSSQMIGQYIPMLTGKHAFVAHWAQTVRYAEKLSWSEQFFKAETDDDWREKLLNDFQIDYVFYGPTEKALGSYLPNQASFLQPTACYYGEVMVYQVR
jgi:hypothetical protein